MTRELRSYTWACPICSEGQSGLDSRDRASIEGQVVNALMSHVRTSDDGGHGPKGSYPPGFDPDDALEYVEVRCEVEDPTLQDTNWESI